jgi:hypothetical protein
MAFPRISRVQSKPKLHRLDDFSISEIILTVKSLLQIYPRVQGAET